VVAAVAFVTTAAASTGTYIVQQAGPGDGYPPLVGVGGGPLTAGPGGAEWIAAEPGTSTTPQLERLTSTGLWKLFPLPADQSTFGIRSVAAGADGALWLTVYASIDSPPSANPNVIDRMSATGVVTEYDLPAGEAAPDRIVAGPDGALWFTCAGLPANQPAIGRITTAGRMTFFPLPSDQSSLTPDAITSGHGGALWFLAQEGNATAIDEISTAGQVTELATIDGGAEDLTVGPDDAIWFVDANANTIGRMTTNGQVSSFPIPTADAEPTAIVAGPDGALWFTEYVADKLARITTAGHITEYPLSLNNGYTIAVNPEQIASGPGNTIWFAPDLSNPSAVGVVDVGGNTAITWRTIYLRGTGPPPPRPPRLTGHLPKTLRLGHGGAIALTLRFTRSGSAVVELTAYPVQSPLPQYRHMFKVRKGVNRLVLRTHGIRTGAHELFVFPLPDTAPHSPYYRGRVTLS
jgi:virginiamycin B lyase